MANIHCSSTTAAIKVDADLEKRVVWLAVGHGAYLALDAEENDQLIAELQRAAQQLRIGTATAQQYAEATTFPKAEAA